jgi:adenine phosphoribosyltransferase
MTETELKARIRDIPDFPKPGIVFKDITPLLADAAALRATVDAFVERYRGKVDVVLGIESRGFIVGSAVAYGLGKGIALVRKPGKLPHRTHSATYDLLATGGTASAAVQLVQRCGGEVAACAFVIELAFLGGRKRLNGQEVFSLLRYDTP